MKVGLPKMDFGCPLGTLKQQTGPFAFVLVFTGCSLHRCFIGFIGCFYCSNICVFSFMRQKRFVNPTWATETCWLPAAEETGSPGAFDVLVLN